ncbi:MAG: ribonuclease P protein component [Elusimicrobia bacterium]|nr:ribonuclease P protein component [Elusimicrobiota bacterium]
MPEEKKAEQHFQHKMLSSSKGFSFCYLERLHTSADFNRVFKNGKKLKTVFVNIYVLKRNDNNEVRRLGLVTSRKVGKAVVRNTAKRRLREIFRTNKHKLTPGLDIIFILKPQITSTGYSNLKNTVLDCLESAKFYNDI